MADDGELLRSIAQLQINVLPGAKNLASAADRKLRGLTDAETIALRRTVGDNDQRWVQWGWKWDRVERQLAGAAESVDVLQAALSPEDFAHLKSVAAIQIQKVDDALAAVIVELEEVTPHVVDNVRAHQRDIRAALERAKYDGDLPPDVMSITGEYER